MEFMHLLAGGLGSAAIIFAFFGSLALMMWVDARSKRHQREMEHAERLKALEKGMPLPDADLARARVETNRAWAAGLVGLFVPIGMGGLAIAGTALVLAQADAAIHLPILCVIWGVMGLVSFITASVALGNIRPGSSDKPKKPVRPQKHDSQDVSEHIRAPVYQD